MPASAIGAKGMGVVVALRDPHMNPHNSKKLRGLEALDVTG